MDNNVVLMSWQNDAQAYKAQHELEALAENGAIKIKGIAVVERQQDGTLVAKEFDASGIGAGAFGGGVIGMLVGVLGGPLGMLLGWAGGALIGGSFDLDRSVDISGALSELSKSVPPGAAGLVADIDEGSPAAVDDLAQKSGSAIVRKPVDEVLGELAAAQDAAEAAAREAAKKLREEKRAERKEDFDKKITDLKAKLHR